MRNWQPSKNNSPPDNPLNWRFEDGGIIPEGFGMRRIVVKNRLMGFIIWIDENPDHSWTAKGFGRRPAYSHAKMARWLKQAKDFTAAQFGWQIDDQWESWLPNTCNIR